VTEHVPDIVAKAADATRPTRAEEILLRYAAIVESSDDAIIAKTLDGVISAWNPAAERLFGYTPYEAIGQPITMIIPPDLHEEEYEILSRLRAGERIDHYETVRVTKAGQCIDVSLTISPLRDAAGRIIGCSKIARDVTKAKRAAVNLRRSEQRLTREVAGAKTLQSISTRLISESKPGTLYDQVLGAASRRHSEALQYLAQGADIRVDRAVPRRHCGRNSQPYHTFAWATRTNGCANGRAPRHQTLKP
jgi:PAS domain S-box-containing protein